MKIGFISLMNGFPWGGSEQLWFEAAKFSKNEGSEVFTKTQDWLSWGRAAPKQITELKNIGVQVEHFKEFTKTDYHISRFKRSYLSDKKVEDFINFIDKVDLLVINQGTTYDFITYPELLSAMSKRKVKYVVINHFNYEHKSISWGVIQQAREVFKNAAQVYFVSERNRAVAEHQLLHTFTEYKVILNPINIKQPFPRAYKQNDGIIKFASVARLEIDAKGQDILIELLSSAKWKERNWQLSFFGSGPDEHYLKELVKKLKLEERMFFRGHCDINDIWEESHVLLLPSFGEGTPITLVEAFASGRVVVATDVGGNTEWICDGVNGYIAEYPQIKAFDKALEKCWNEQSQWNCIGSNAFKTFTDKYTTDPVADFIKGLSKLV